MKCLGTLLLALASFATLVATPPARAETPDAGPVESPYFAVRSDDPSTDRLPLKATRVTHLGFVVQKGRRTWLRHARRGVDGNGRVVDEDLESFLARNAKYDKWKVTGVSLFEVRAPSETGASAASTP